MTLEIPLSGGTMSGAVVRVGDTVRRPSGPWTPAVHALLTHLHDTGFRGAPRSLGLDDQGREVLTFMPGTLAWFGDAHVLDPDDQLRRVGRLIRDFHDAVTGFVPPPDARWQALIPADGDEIIAHHDLAPWNLVIDEDRWAFIDWDTAAPGTRLWDFAYAAHGFIPLNPGQPDAAAAHRLRVLADAYGLTETQRTQLVPLLARRSRSMHDFLADQAALGNQPWTRLWDEGHGDVWRTDADHTAQREHVWQQALLD